LVRGDPARAAYKPQNIDAATHIPATFPDGAQCPSFGWFFTGETTLGRKRSIRLLARTSAPARFRGAPTPPTDRQSWPRSARPARKRPTGNPIQRNEIEIISSIEECRLSACRQGLLTDITVGESLVRGISHASRNATFFDQSTIGPDMDSVRRLKPEYNNIAALRRLVDKINNGPDSDGLSEEQVERVALELAMHYGLELNQEVLDTVSRGK
jgi:hypothetical protein